MIIDVAYFMDDEKKRKEMLFWTTVRHMTLDECYQVPGYKDLPTAEKNKIYDAKRKETERREKR